MKIDIFLVHLLVVSAVCIPYILFIFAAVKERKNLKSIFYKEALKLDLDPDRVDRWNGNIVGLDTHLRRLLFVQSRKNEVVVKTIDLKNIKKTALLYETQSMKVNDRKEDILQSIDLELNFHNGEKELLNLYDCEITYSQDYEMKNAEKWNRILNESLSFRPSVHSAA